jgi:hypothetical protein
MPEQNAACTQRILCYYIVQDPDINVKFFSEYLHLPQKAIYYLLQSWEMFDLKLRISIQELSMKRWHELW